MITTAREVKKSFRVSLKAVNEDEGTAVALVSAFEVVDSYDEMIMPGAFDKSLEQFGEDPIPILWNHQWGVMDAHLAEGKGEITAEGLVMTMQFDMTDPTSAKAFRLLKSKRIKEFSIGGFEPVDGIKRVEKDGQDVWAIYEFELVEVSLVLRGANPDTRLIDVKSAAELVAVVETDTAAAAKASAAEDHPTEDQDADTSAADRVARDRALLNLTTTATQAEKGDSL